MKPDNNQRAFLALVRAGLWEKNVPLHEPFDLKEVYRLSQEQAVVGLVAAGLEHVNDVKLPPKDVLLFIGDALQMEQRNTAMNSFIGDTVRTMREAGIYTLLVKGQEIAQCYVKPLWRACGDIDFYLSESEFVKARSFFLPLVDAIDPANDCARNVNMHYKSWIVEIHANQYCRLSWKIDRVLDDIHYDIFYNGKVRSCKIGGSQVFLPSADNDVLLVFTHFLKHFYYGGIGLRQICDWCRLLWQYRDSIDRDLLKLRLSKMGLITEWKAFASFVVNTLGMPVAAIPFYDSNIKWQKKASRIEAFLLEVGNMGHNRDTSYYGKYPYVIKKTMSMFRRIGDLIRHARVFPLDSIRFFFGIMYSGLQSVSHGD